MPTLAAWVPAKRWRSTAIIGVFSAFSLELWSGKRTVKVAALSVYCIPFLCLTDMACMFALPIMACRFISRLHMFEAKHAQSCPLKHVIVVHNMSVVKCHGL